MYQQRRVKTAKERCTALKRKICIYFSLLLAFLTQLLLSQTVLSYGMYLVDFSGVTKINSFLKGQWVPVAFLTATKITKPCIRSILNQKRYRQNLIYSTLGLFATHIISSLNYLPLNQIITLGIFGGVLSAILSINLELKCHKAFSKWPKVHEKMFLVAEAISLLIFPKFIYYLNDTYSSPTSQRIIGAILLNLIPLGLLIKQPHKKQAVKHAVSYHRGPGSEKDELSVHSSVQNEEIDSEDDDVDSDEDDDDKKLEESHDYIPTSRSHHRLSKIIEEDETEMNENVRKSMNMRRVSEIIRKESEKLQVDFCKQNTDEDYGALDKKWSTIDLQKENLYVKLKRRVLNVLLNVYFYPTLFSSCILTVFSNTFVFIVPFIVVDKEKTFGLNDSRAAQKVLTDCFGVTLSIVRILITLVHNKLPTVAVKIIFLFSNMLLSISYVNMKNYSLNSIRINFSIQYALCSCVEQELYETFIHNSKRLKSPIEFFSGITLIISYSIFYFNFFEIDQFFNTGGALLFSNYLLWMIIIFIKWIVTSCIKYRHCVINDANFYNNNL